MLNSPFHAWINIFVPNSLAHSVPNTSTATQETVVFANLKQTGSQFLKFLLQLVPDLWQTLTLLIFKFQFLRWTEKKQRINWERKTAPSTFLFNSLFVYACAYKVGYHTLLAASNCSLRISEPFSLISFSLSSSEELCSLVSSPWDLPEGGPPWTPPSSLRSGSGSRSTNLQKTTNKRSPKQHTSKVTNKSHSSPPKDVKDYNKSKKCKKKKQNNCWWLKAQVECTSRIKESTGAAQMVSFKINNRKGST